VNPAHLPDRAWARAMRDTIEAEMQAYLAQLTADALREMADGELQLPDLSRGIHGIIIGRRELTGADAQRIGRSGGNSHPRRF
jgi:hypothetical protein